MSTWAKIMKDALHLVYSIIAALMLVLGALYLMIAIGENSIDALKLAGCLFVSTIGIIYLDVQQLDRQYSKGN